MKQVSLIISALLLLLSTLASAANGQVLCLHEGDMHLDIANHTPHKQTCCGHDHAPKVATPSACQLEIPCVDIAILAEATCLRVLELTTLCDHSFVLIQLPTFFFTNTEAAAEDVYASPLAARAPPGELKFPETHILFLTHIRLLN